MPRMKAVLGGLNCKSHHASAVPSEMLLMEKNPAPLISCPIFFKTSIKTFSGIVTGAGFFCSINRMGPDVCCGWFL